MYLVSWAELERVTLNGTTKNMVGADMYFKGVSAVSLLKAGLVREVEAYLWSSIRAYTIGKDHLKGLTETEFILSMFHEDRIKAIQAFQEFMKQEGEDNCLDLDIKQKKNDEEVKVEIETLMDGRLIGELQSME